MQRLEDQGDVERLAVRYGPRGVVEAFSGARLHDVPFLSGGTAPPPVVRVLVDGHGAGSVLNVTDAAEAAVVDETLMSLPYELLDTTRRVTLLGETDGLHTWLAIRHGAQRIDVVQPDANIVAMLGGPLRDCGGAVLQRPEVRVTVADPRNFIERAGGPF
ncbi:hypothetical protein, partial [Hydrogenophaga sp.]|uniref:hypothetical protein n=1 Tax=Hydrogenophaga sp. TaxID=1904254 RepID=UPI0025BAF8C7